MLLYCFVLYCVVLYCIVLFCFVSISLVSLGITDVPDSNKPSQFPPCSLSLPPSLPLLPLSLPGLIFIASSLLNKNQTTRMGMCGMLLHPFLVARTNSFPSHYKPRNIEERIKRGQCRQLQVQIETLSQSKNSSLTVTFL
jgi:hypothetical protein